MSDLPMDEKNVSSVSNKMVSAVSSPDSSISPFWQQKYRQESSKSWNLFYKRNERRFFKDRHWIRRELPQLFANDDSSSMMLVLEVGCGVGNFVFPYLEENQTVKRVYACDFSEKAIDLVKNDERYTSTGNRCTAFVADITIAGILRTNIPDSPCIDIITSIFVLSAIPPEKHIQVLENFKSVLKARGGIVVFRDYAKEDAAQLRFRADRQLDTDLFVRQDGTLAYYFDKGKLIELFSTLGFICDRCDWVHSKTTNIKKEIDVNRLFIQAIFKLDT